ncbi:MAG TPA: SMC-Scp complex subunit ScpB [Vicinamibacterales bacterium]|nr:SMC-Scp complex subunit ScpB [Vicinamibacterales bacterium]HPW21953.1 SMC-Scp complex subunit ScpB [Vicinamibacterales bacterium]
METWESREKAADDTVSEPHEDPDKADRIAGATSDASVAIDEIPGLAHPPATGGPAGPPVSEGLKAIVEALVFASPEPLTPKALFKLLDGEPREEVERALDALKADYAAARGLQIVEIAGGLQIVTRTDLHEWVRRLFRERRTTKLSLPALETLAVVAYRQPVTAAEIAEIRGVNTAGVLGTLMERKLVKIAGRKPVVGRPFLYATTREFLIRFGLNDLADLPKVEEMADALGFDLPGMAEAGPTDQYLPLDLPGGDLEAGPPAEGASGGAAGAAPGPADPTGDPPAR